MQSSKLKHWLTLSPLCLVAISASALSFPQSSHADSDDALPTAVKMSPAAANSAEPDGDDDGDDDDGTSSQPVAVIVTAHRLDAARASINASLGASTYSFSNSLVEMRPGGETVSLSQVLLQAPGVTQQASGQLQVRGETNLQYRINNVIIPDGFTDLAESLSARMEQSIELVTGALPAQYGLQVGGVVNIITQSGVYQQGGQAELYGGGQGEIEPAIEYATSIAGTNIYTSGSYLQNDSGLSSLDGSAVPHHDKTRQWEAFGYFDHALDDQSRISLILGGTAERFQIPSISGLNAATYPPHQTAFQRPLNVNGLSSYRSDDLRGHEDDSGVYGILSYLWSSDKLTLQASTFAHVSSYNLTPDATGDLLFSGLSQKIDEKQTTGGLQLEASYLLSDAHTLRSGLVMSWDRQTSAIASLVLPVNGMGQQTSTLPVNITNRAIDTSSVASIFAEDEWKVIDALTLNAGLRFDHVRGQTNDDQISPRLNLVWKTSEDTTLHAGYARYFVPSPDDESAGRTQQLAGTTGAPPSLMANDLKAETDDYYDIGAQKKTRNLTLGIDAYWREAQNLIGQVPIGQTLLQRAFNYAKGRLHGVEFSANYAKGPLTFWSNLAVARSEGRNIVSGQFTFTPDELTYLAKHYAPTSQDQTYTASGGASYSWGALRLSSDLLYGSGTPRTLSGEAPNAARMPAYIQVNVSALYRTEGFEGKRLDLKFDVINAFDGRYELADGTAIGGGVPQWGPRRGVFIGAEQSF